LRKPAVEAAGLFDRLHLERRIRAVS
jgi:hypothetical protein